MAGYGPESSHCVVDQGRGENVIEFYRKKFEGENGIVN